MKLLLGTKLGMTQLFDEAGVVTPVTVLEVGPCQVVQVRSEERDGYRAVQIGYKAQKPRRVTKPLQGHFKAAGVQPYRFLKESRLLESASEEAAPVPGDQIRVDQVFAEGSYVDVIGTSKGRGFSGTVRRHGFGRGPEAHGSKNVREPGSTGMHTYPGRVFKGKKMPGQYGAKRRTVKNLMVVKVEGEANRLFVRGAVPGPIGGLVSVQLAKTPPPAAKGS